MRLGHRAKTDSKIPTSSMADIAFLLIIFFMVTSVFSATKGLELKLPTVEEPPPVPEPAVFVHVQRERVVAAKSFRTSNRDCFETRTSR